VNYKKIPLGEICLKSIVFDLQKKVIAANIGWTKKQWSSKIGMGYIAPVRLLPCFCGLQIQAEEVD
jgi:hypothetical protein